MKSTSLSLTESFVKIFLPIFLFSMVLLNSSCSTDNEDTIEVIDNSQISDDTENNDGTDNDVDENPDTSGAIVFEENFVLEDNRRLVNFVLSNNEYNKFLEGEGDVKMVSQKVYEHFNDDFDFIFILSVEEQQPDGLYYGRSYKVKNDVQGLGMSLYEGTPEYGSLGTLKSVIHMPRTEYIVNGPFLHEIAHYWSNHSFIPTTIGGHWGYSSAGGQLGGFDELIDLGNNTYQGKLNGKNGFGPNANGGNSVPYSNIELYAMGLISSGELESIQVAENPERGSAFGQFTADAITTLTNADLITQHGERVPSVQNSQKSFKALAVIISTTKIGEDQSDTISRHLENFARQGTPDGYWGNTYNFWMATGERASLDIQVLDEDLK
ncbi:hypothetical protein [Ulvibacterium marinum]|uniref:Uncharacterized protein n=1 Tax=Ulvibacterium marinum TaxID=2419782 RepID=A0A3B0C0J4_9FLAO|nr:hypothetical protein [Ulvibacterium marinum]RKN79435.1 hypothetical protein D7Z94_14080 [Ulvibacterium marinum]